MSVPSSRGLIFLSGDGLLKIFRRFINPVLSGQEEAELIGCLGVLRLKVQGPVEQLFSLLEMSQFPVRPSCTDQSESGSASGSSFGSIRASPR